MTALAEVAEDLGYVVRRLSRVRLLNVLVLLIAGIGVGAVTAMYGVVDSTLLAPLPYLHPEELVQVSEVNPSVVVLGQGAGSDGPVSAQNFLDYQSRNASLAGMAWTVEFAGGEATLTGGQGPAAVARAMSVSASFFRVLGVEMLLGRPFFEEETALRGPSWRAEGKGVAIITHEVWRGRFGGDPDIIGKDVDFDGGASTIVGVLPERFRFPPFSRGGRALERDVDIYVPMYFSAFRQPRDVRRLTVIGRMRPGVSVPQVEGDLNRVLSGVRAEFPDAQQGWSVAVERMDGIVARDFGVPLLSLLLLAALLLAVGCANLAALALVQRERRATELEIRVALGARRGRLLRLVALESATLAMAGGALGVAIARWGAKGVLALAPPDLPHTLALSGGRVVLLALCACVAIGLSLWLLPAIGVMRVSRRDRVVYPRFAGPRKGAAFWLILVQVSLTICLLSSAVVLTHNLVRLRDAQTGFDATDVLAVAVKRGSLDRFFEVGLWDVAERRARWRLSAALLDKLRSLPGVVSAASGSLSTSETQLFRIQVDASGSMGGDRQAESFVRFVSPEYFATLGIPIVRGSGLPAWGQGNDPDRYWWSVDGPTCNAQAKQNANPRFMDPLEECDAPGVLVSESFASAVWPRDEPIGKRLGMGGCCWTVVGVARDVHVRGVDAPALEGQVQRYPAMTIYVPYTDLGPFLVRSRSDARHLIPAVRAAVAEFGIEGVVSVSLLSDDIAESLARPRFYSVLASILGIASLLMAVVGLYGVVDYSVSRRVREVGVRMAVGAARGDVLGMVVQDGMRPVMFGALFGIPLSLGTLAALGRLLYNVTPFQIRSVLAVSALTMLVSAAACYGPARRATAIDPRQALVAE